MMGKEARTSLSSYLDMHELECPRAVAIAATFGCQNRWNDDVFVAWKRLLCCDSGDIGVVWAQWHAFIG